MAEKIEQNLEVIETAQETRGNEVVDQPRFAHQTNPIARKLLDFSLSNKTRRFSVRDLLKR